VLLIEKQRRANESLVAVNAVLQLSRQVVNESRTLQSSLETTEATALTALHRATQQHTAVHALKQVALFAHYFYLPVCLFVLSA